jgi:hypothetical protein
MNGLRALSLVVCGVVSFAACARGTAVETTYAPGSGGAGGFGGDPSGDTTSGDATTGDGSATSGAGGTGSGAGGDPATTSATSTTGSSSASSTGSGGPVCDYKAPNNCQSSETMAAIDGDKNNDTRIVKGTTSKWFKVLVNEAVSSVISFPQLSYTASLVSPAGMDFDLFVYDGTTSTPSCSGNPTHATGNPESASETWGDTLNSDDTKWLTLEVRYISGDMCPSDQWVLTVKGHTN